MPENVPHARERARGTRLDERRTAGYFCIAVALLLIGAWSVQLAREAVPEVRTEGPHLLFVLGAELLAAEVLVVAGVGLLYGRRWADRAFLFAMGMMGYSVLNHIGAWLEAGALGQVLMAVALGMAGLALMALTLGQGPRRPVATEVNSEGAWAA